MNTTEAEEWAFAFIANAIRDRIVYGGEAIHTIAYTLFDHVLSEPSGNRLHLTPPTDPRPSIFIKKLSSGQYEIVIQWDGVEKHRSELEDELLPAIRKILP